MTNILLAHWAYVISSAYCLYTAHYILEEWMSLHPWRGWVFVSRSGMACCLLIRFEERDRQQVLYARGTLALEPLA